MADLGTLTTVTPPDQDPSGNVVDIGFSYPAFSVQTDEDYLYTIDAASDMGFQHTDFPTLTGAITRTAGIVGTVTNGNGGGTNQDPLPTNVYKIYGTVKVETSPGTFTPVARNVRVYRRDNGAYLGSAASDAVTGDFELSVPDYFGLCYCIALDDDDAPDYNALIIDRVTPVLPP